MLIYEQENNLKGFFSAVINTRNDLSFFAGEISREERECLLINFKQDLSFRISLSIYLYIYIYVKFLKNNTKVMEFRIHYVFFKWFWLSEENFFFFVTSIKIMFKALKYRNENTKIFE